jgi:hypothetical protein
MTLAGREFDGSYIPLLLMPDSAYCGVELASTDASLKSGISRKKGPMQHGSLSSTASANGNSSKRRARCACTAP